jgi:hypothetical protein
VPNRRLWPKLLRDVTLTAAWFDYLTANAS